jgi:uncharacterized integral membrane protein (TIGR00697 family)
MISFLRINKLDFVVAVYIFCVLLSELMGAKTFPLFNIGSFTLNSSVAIFLFPLTFTINDIVAEVYGKERARSLVRSGLIIVAMLIVYSLIATMLPPSGRFSGTEAAYDTIFGTSIRFSIASLLAFLSSEFLDVAIFTKLRAKFGTTRLWLRTNVSNFISQFVDSLVFMVIAFYAIDKGFGSNVSFILSLMIPYWLLKCAMSVVETPFAYLGVKWLRKDSEQKVHPN